MIPMSIITMETQTPEDLVSENIIIINCMGVAYWGVLSSTYLFLSGHIGIAVPDVYAACERFDKFNVEYVKKPDGGKYHINIHNLIIWTTMKPLYNELNCGDLKNCP